MWASRAPGRLDPRSPHRDPRGVHRGQPGPLCTAASGAFLQRGNFPREPVLRLKDEKTKAGVHTPPVFPKGPFCGSGPARSWGAAGNQTSSLPGSGGGALATGDLAVVPTTGVGLGAGESAWPRPEGVTGLCIWTGMCVGGQPGLQGGQRWRGPRGAAGPGGWSRAGPGHAAEGAGGRHQISRQEVYFLFYLLGSGKSVEGNPCFAGGRMSLAPPSKG